jgi:hypothetical protein
VKEEKKHEVLQNHCLELVDRVRSVLVRDFLSEENNFIKVLEELTPLLETLLKADFTLNPENPINPRQRLSLMIHKLFLYTYQYQIPDPAASTIELGQAMRVQQKIFYTPHTGLIARWERELKRKKKTNGDDMKEETNGLRNDATPGTAPEGEKEEEESPGSDSQGDSPDPESTA